MTRSCSSRCPVCEDTLIAEEEINGGQWYQYNCPRCGQFRFVEDLHDLWASYAPKNDRQRAAISYAIRRAQRTNQRPIFSSDVIMRIRDECSLPTPQEQVDNLIRWIGDNQPAFGERVKINIVDHRAIAGSSTDNNFLFFIKFMTDENLIDAVMGPYKSSSGGAIQHHMGGCADATLTFKGWERYEALRRGGASGDMAFMAMKFGDSELDGLLNAHFRQAVKATGFDLRRLDDNPQAGLIDDRLRVDIKASRFLIADLTHANHGAYWEAGFAEGLGKPVIYTCKECVFSDPQSRPHFDTNHHLTVLWNPAQPEDACERLKATIRATLPEAKQQD